MSDPIKNRYEFVVLFDVENGNPNGDPDAGNMPRVDPETGYGLVTDVCLKRKIRNYVEMAKEGEKGYRIYIKDGVPLNSSDKEACAYVGADPDKLKEAKKKDEHLDEKIRDFMCSNFYDIRTFGAVLLTDTGRRTFLQKWQERKKETITHPFLEEKIPWGLVPYVQSLLLARSLRGDLDDYPPC